MKTKKTIIKITAFAAVFALALLSCSPEAELTAPDWSECDSQKDARYTDTQNTSTEISIADGSIPWNATQPAPPDVEKQLTVRFPADADFLKNSNTGIESAMKEFFKIITFTNPDYDTATATKEQFSAEGAELPYSFVRRVNTGGDPSFTDIIIQVDISSLPAEQKTTASERIGVIAKIIGSKYKRDGRAIDLDNDGNAGEDFYDDDIIHSLKSGGISYTSPVKTLTLTINGAGLAGSTFTETTAARPLQIATLSGSGIGGSPADDAGNIRRKEISESLISLIKLQKFDENSKGWTDTGASIVYQNDPAATGTIGGYFGSLVVTSFTPADFGIYRIFVDGIKGKKVTNAFFEKERKITVGGATEPATLGLRHNRYYKGIYQFYNSDLHVVRDLPIVTTDKFYYDNAGKNATVELVFGNLYFTPPGADAAADYWLAEDFPDFKKTVKFALRWSGLTQVAVTNLKSQNDFYFIDYDLVKIEKHYNPGTSTPQVGTKVTIKLKGDVKYTNGLLLTLVLSPDFQYQHNVIYFGDPTAYDVVIDGVSRWKIHGTVQL